MSGGDHSRDRNERTIPRRRLLRSAGAIGLAGLTGGAGIASAAGSVESLERVDPVADPPGVAAVPPLTDPLPDSIAI